MNKLFVQVKLKHIATGNYMTCWLENDPKIKVGRRLTIKNCGFAKSEDWWEILEKYNVLPKEQLHIDWQVGGLGATT